MAGKGILLITGGSRGIGAATALLAGRAGYHVAVNYLANAEAAASVVASIEADGGKAFAMQGDASTASGVAAIFAEVDKRGRLAGLVNNAGIVAPSSRVDQMDEARLERMMRTNIVGPFLCAGEAVRRMSTAKGGEGGAIVNLSSAAARLGSPGEYVDYAASKAAIDIFTVGLAKEVAAEGIRVNALRPGLIETEIHASGGNPDRVAALRHQVPMGRGGTAEEVARAVLFLLSDEASYITGALVDIGGGR
jgi:NAD(P)-dependent dehydrogenase (short-subunit alcohol dehydrogenase family)